MGEHPWNEILAPTHNYCLCRIILSRSWSFMVPPAPGPWGSPEAEGRPGHPPPQLCASSIPVFTAAVHVDPGVKVTGAVMGMATCSRERPRDRHAHAGSLCLWAWMWGRHTACILLSFLNQACSLAGHHVPNGKNNPHLPASSRQFCFYEFHLALACKVLFREKTLQLVGRGAL